jgi:hypothetical protein
MTVLLELAKSSSTGSVITPSAEEKNENMYVVWY